MMPIIHYAKIVSIDTFANFISIAKTISKRILF